MSAKEEKSVILASDIYVRAKKFCTKLKTTHLPTIGIYGIDSDCNTGATLLYLAHTHAHSFWKEGVEYYYDFLKIQKKIKNTNPKDLWGHALDIKKSLETKGVSETPPSAERTFRSKLERFDKLDSKNELAFLWENKWIEEFYLFSIYLIEDFIRDFDDSLCLSDVNQFPNATLAQIEVQLYEFQEEFLRNARAIGPYKYPDELSVVCPSPWNDGSVEDMGPKIGSQSGTLEINIRVNEIVFCRFYPNIFDRDNDSVSWELKGDESVEPYHPQRFKAEIFNTWDYSTGEFLGQMNTDEKAYWFIDDTWAVGPHSSYIIDKYVYKLLTNKEYEELAKKTIKVLRNSSPEWYPGKVQWPYIKELDRLICDYEYARICNKLDVCGFVSPEDDNGALLTLETPETNIPAEFKSPPMSLKEMAGYFGKSTSPRKIKAMIDSGSLSVETISRESFYFDLRRLPEYVQKAIQKRIS